MYRRRAKGSHGGATRNQQRSHCSNAKQMVRRPITRSLTTRVTRSGRKLCCLHHHQYVVSNVVITTPHKPKSYKSSSDPDVYMYKHIPHLDDDAKRIKTPGSNKRSPAWTLGLNNIRSEASIRDTKRLILWSLDSDPWTPSRMTTKPDAYLLSTSSVAADCLVAACEHDGEAHSVSTSSLPFPKEPDHLTNDDHEATYCTMEDNNSDCRSSLLTDHNRDDSPIRLAEQSKNSSTSCTLHDDRHMINNDGLNNHHHKSSLGSINSTIVDNDQSKSTSSKHDSSPNSCSIDEAKTVPTNKDDLQFHVNHAHDPPLPSSSSSSSSLPSSLSPSSICYGNKCSPAANSIDNHASAPPASSFSSASSSSSSSPSSFSSSSFLHELHAANIKTENHPSVNLSSSERYHTIGGPSNFLKVGLSEPVVINTTRNMSIGAGPCPSQLQLIHPMSFPANDTETTQLLRP